MAEANEPLVEIGEAAEAVPAINGVLAIYNIEVDRARGVVYLMQWEKFDLEKKQVHVSCPKCFSLTRAPIHLVMEQIQCAHCPFAAVVRFNETATAEWNAYRNGLVQSAGVVDSVEEEAIAKVGPDEVMNGPLAADVRNVKYSAVREVAIDQGYWPSYRIRETEDAPVRTSSKFKAATDADARFRDELIREVSRVAMTGEPIPTFSLLDKLEEVFKYAGVRLITTEFFKQIGNDD